MTSDLDLLRVQYRTLFLTTESGRIVRENDPDHSSGPRFWLGGCATGNLAGLRMDVPASIADEIMALVATEPIFLERGSRPRHLARYLELLSQKGAAPRQSFLMNYQLPNDLEFERRPVLIHSENEESRRLLDFFTTHGIPDDLQELGFRDVSEFWEPWCFALHESRIASVAIAARLSETGAELGISTVRTLRGRGFAAAAAAGWSRLKSLRSRVLFYSTHRTNVSSQRVAERLGLRYLGASLRLS